MMVRLFDCDDNAIVWEGDLSEFFVDNEMATDEADDIERDLAKDGASYIGGGASPSFRLEVTS